MRSAILLPSALLLMWGALCARSACAADPPATSPATLPFKPKIAFFPLGGNASADLRGQIARSLRLKLERTQKYDVIDGYTLSDLVGDKAIPLNTPDSDLRKLNEQINANVLVWGDLRNDGTTKELSVKILDLRDARPAVRQIDKKIATNADFRFALEQILNALPGIGSFEHPNESAVTRDPVAEALWKKNPNLVPNADFSDSGGWTVLYRSEKYPVQISDHPPPVDKVNIYQSAEAGRINNVLAMNLSRRCVENNGMACLSDQIKIIPNRRYRLAFRYKSDGPHLHVFVKGYTWGKDIKGQKTLREDFRRQVPPSGATQGQWVQVVCDLNPQNVSHSVEYLKIDLYAYLVPGQVMFDDVVLKEVGRQTDDGRDEAIHP